MGVNEPEKTDHTKHPEYIGGFIQSGLMVSHRLTDEIRHAQTSEDKKKWLQKLLEQQEALCAYIREQLA